MAAALDQLSNLVVQWRPPANLPSNSHISHNPTKRNHCFAFLAILLSLAIVKGALHCAEILKKPMASLYAAAARKCSSCGAWGKDVVQAHGFCNHCFRTQGAASAGAASTSSSSSSPPRLSGMKRRAADSIQGAYGVDESRVAAAGGAAAAAEQDDIQAMLAAADAVDAPTLDASGAKKMLLALEKKINKNYQMRAKFSHEPVKFMESEVELDEELKKMRALAAAPEHYPLLISTGTLRSLLGLLSHDNSDIASDVILLLEELTDEDAISGIGLEAEEEDEEEEDGRGGKKSAAAAAGQLLVRTLLQEGIMELVLQHVKRLQEAAAASAAAGSGGASSSSSSSAGASFSLEDDAVAAEGLYHSLSFLQNMVSASEQVSSFLAGNPQPSAAASGDGADRGEDSSSSLSSKSGRSSGSELLGYLLQRMLSGGYSAVSQASSELLSLLLQSEEGLAALLGASAFTLQLQQQSKAASSRSSTTTVSVSVSMNGLEALLELISRFRKQPPTGLEEEEHVANTVDCLCSVLVSRGGEGMGRDGVCGVVCACLCEEGKGAAAAFWKRNVPSLSCLLHLSSPPPPCAALPLCLPLPLQILPENQARFRAFEGFELLLRCMRDTGFLRYPSLRACSYAQAYSPANCRSFIEAGGLKELFPAFLGKGAAHTRKTHGPSAAAKETEYSLDILAGCMELLPPAGSAGEGLLKLRLLAKFKEGEYQKLDRLVELLRQYSTAVTAATAAFTAEERPGDFDSEQERQVVLKARRQDAGLLSLQKLALVLAALLQEGAAAAAGSAGGGSRLEPTHASLLEELSFQARSKLFEQRLSLVSIMELLLEYGEQQLPESKNDRNASAVETMQRGCEAALSCLQTLAGISVEEVKRGGLKTQ